MPSSPTKLKVLVFAASLRAESLNRKLAALAARVAEQNGATVDLASMRDFDVPSYDGDVEAARGSRPGREELQRRLLENDAFIISSPEYNGSMPGMLKNLIDWTSRFRPQPFDGRHGLLLSASPSLAGGNRGLWALAHAARAPRRADLPGHVLALDGAQGVRRRRSRRPRAASALREEPAGVSRRSPRRRSTTRASSGRGSSSSASRRARARTASTRLQSRPDERSFRSEPP